MKLSILSDLLRGLCLGRLAEALLALHELVELLLVHVAGRLLLLKVELGGGLLLLRGRLLELLHEVHLMNVGGTNALLGSLGGGLLLNAHGLAAGVLLGAALRSLLSRGGEVLVGLVGGGSLLLQCEILLHLELSIGGLLLL